MTNQPPHRLVLVAALCVAGLCSCATRTSSPPARQQTGESVVCVGEEPAALAWLPERGQPIRARSTYLPSADTIEYVDGRDFTVDYADGTLRRTSQSRIPDYRTNSLFGKLDFNHSQFPGFGNRGFFVYVDYTFRAAQPWPVQLPQAQFLPRARARLAAGQPVKIVAFGDSITAGADVSKPEYIFWNRWAEELRRKHPNSAITAENGATGGDSTIQGLQRLQTKVLERQPDLVLIGFGMNDHNRQGVPVPQFEQNLRQIISRIRQETAAEVVLYSAFPPNPNWKFGSHHMADYAAATERVARETSSAYADVFNNWQALAARKKPEDLLANDINHPSDFGHWIYCRVLSELGL